MCPSLSWIKMDCWLLGFTFRISIFRALLVGGTFLLILFVTHQQIVQSWSNKVHLQEEIADVLVLQRKLLIEEMAHYPYLEESSDKPATMLSNLVPELGGEPKRNIIVSSCRSGSSFLYSIINSHPGMYSTFEPLLRYGCTKIRGPPDAEEAKGVIRGLLDCDLFSARFLIDSKGYLNRNTRLWKQCELHPQICWLPSFLSQFCRLFPFQFMKLVRAQLQLLEEILADERLNVRVVYLVRDPRGILHSRMQNDFCQGDSECELPEYLCGDLVADYEVAIKLNEKYPDRFKSIRYEDLSLDPNHTVQALFKFFGLSFHQSVKTYLDSHTKVDVAGAYSTSRNSSATAFLWRQNMTFQEVQVIQKHCSTAMNYWGYIEAKNEKHQREFHPIKSYSIT